MKRLCVAVALAASMVSAFATVAPVDPNVAAAAGSFAAGGSTNTSLPVETLPTVSPVPEADALALWAAGLGVVGALVLRRRR